jgi:hypothetical protein
MEKTITKHKKLALHKLDVALLNGHALYLMHNEKGISLPDFQMSVIRGLLEKHKEESHLAVEGVQVETFLNIWQTVTYLALLDQRML